MYKNLNMLNDNQNNLGTHKVKYSSTEECKRQTQEHIKLIGKSQIKFIGHLAKYILIVDLNTMERKLLEKEVREEGGTRLCTKFVMFVACKDASRIKKNHTRQESTMSC